MGRKKSRELIQGLREIFDAPVPDQGRKRRFLWAYPGPRLPLWQFVFIQMSYIRKRTWLLSLSLLLPALSAAYAVDGDVLWAASALAPFLGLLAVTESMRSALYGMDEFEMSARFSLKSVLLARMGILGLLDAFILCCFIPLCDGGGRISLFRAGLYILVPYLMTVTASLWLTRCFYSRDIIYGCMGVAVSVSGGNAFLHMAADFMHQNSNIVVWVSLSLFLFWKTAQEIYRMIRQTEELVWNL